MLSRTRASLCLVLLLGCLAIWPGVSAQASPTTVIAASGWSLAGFFQWLEQRWSDWTSTSNEDSPAARNKDGLTTGQTGGTIGGTGGSGGPTGPSPLPDGFL